MQARGGYLRDGVERRWGVLRIYVPWALAWNASPHSPTASLLPPGSGGGLVLWHSQVFSPYPINGLGASIVLQYLWHPRSHLPPVCSLATSKFTGSKAALPRRRTWQIATLSACVALPRLSSVWREVVDVTRHQPHHSHMI
jgi:hypothetical protein